MSETFGVVFIFLLVETYLHINVLFLFEVQVTVQV